jgi:hypothetical protein
MIRWKGGYPSARNIRFSNIRLVEATVVAEVVQIAPEKPVEGLSLTNISGTATRGITLHHVRDAVIRDLTVTGLTGPLLAIRDVTGSGIEGAAEYAPPASTPAPTRASAAGDKN